MRNLIGMEMTCFGRSRFFELVYEGGSYVDDKGEAVDDVMDMACYICSTSYFTREGDAVGYCPNCGHIDRKRFDRREDLVAFLLGNDLSWAPKAQLMPVTVKTHDGDWRLRFTKDVGRLTASGQFREVRKL